MGDLDGTSYVPQNLTNDANLRRLEAAVQTACEAIYAQREGYWPSDMERHHIAIALLSQFDRRPCDCSLSMSPKDWFGVPEHLRDGRHDPECASHSGSDA